MGLKQRIVDRGKQALLQPSVLRWVTDDRVMKATEGLMDARTRVKDAWKVLLNGNELPNIDPALDENIGQTEPAVTKSNGHKQWPRQRRRANGGDQRQRSERPTAAATAPAST